MTSPHYYSFLASLLKKFNVLILTLSTWFLPADGSLLDTLATASVFNFCMIFFLDLTRDPTYHFFALVEKLSFVAPKHLTNPQNSSVDVAQKAVVETRAV